MGIEPTPTAWQAVVQPLNYGRFVLRHPGNIRFIASRKRPDKSGRIRTISRAGANMLAAARMGQ